MATVAAFQNRVADQRHAEPFCELVNLHRIVQSRGGEGAEFAVMRASAMLQRLARSC